MCILKTKCQMCQAIECYRVLELIILMRLEFLILFGLSFFVVSIFIISDVIKI